MRSSTCAIPPSPSLAGDWTKGTAANGGGHDVTEIAPGRVVTSSSPILYLDARKDPAHPKVLAQGPPPDDRFIHSNLWPDQGRDRFLLVGGETTGNCDDEGSGKFMTWDTKGWQKTHTFHMVDQLGMTNGLYTDGKAPADQWCAHWFATHPSYHDGGLVAMDWYDHGTRFLNVSSTGKISEVGYFIGAGTQASAPYWVTDRILYSVDYNRGVDILKYTGSSSFPRTSGAFPPHTWKSDGDGRVPVRYDLDAHRAGRTCVGRGRRSAPVEVVLERARGRPRSLRGRRTGPEARYELVFKSFLPYTLSLRARIDEYVARSRMVIRTEGELEGTAEFTVEDIAAGTRTTLEWTTRTTKPWMNALAFVMRDLFAWNHDVLMRKAGDGLAALLGADVTQAEGSAPSLARALLPLAAAVGAVVLVSRGVVRSAGRR